MLHSTTPPSFPQDRDFLLMSGCNPQPFFLPNYPQEPTLTLISPDDPDQRPVTRAYKGYWMPVEIDEHPRLTSLQKRLAVEIDSLDGDEGCFASVAFFAKKFDVTERHISRSITVLLKEGLVEEIRSTGRSRFLRGHSKLANEGRTRTRKNPKVSENTTQKRRTNSVKMLPNVGSDLTFWSGHVTSDRTGMSPQPSNPTLSTLINKYSKTEPHPPLGGDICEGASLSFGEGGAQGGVASHPGPIPPKGEGPHSRKDLPSPDVEVAEGVRFKAGEMEALLAKCEAAVSAHSITGTAEEVRRECLEQLSAYKGASGKRYRSDYRAILSWVLPKVIEARLRLMRLKSGPVRLGPDGRPPRVRGGGHVAADEVYDNIFDRRRL